jgi:UDP-glucose 4-epimerase
MGRGTSGALYNVGGGTEATMRDAIETLEDVSGRTLDLVARPVAAGDVRRTAADTARIERDLGWRATTDLGAGLRAQWEWASVRVAAP